MGELGNEGSIRNAKVLVKWVATRFDREGVGEFGSD